MIARTATGSAIFRFMSHLTIEAKFATRGAPKILRSVAIAAGWVGISVLYGLIVGFAAVFLPPTAAFGFVAPALQVQLWVTPDLMIDPLKLVRKAFFVLLVVDLCVPYYYTVQIVGLPWISARRVATFALIAPFVVGVAASANVRKRITDRIQRSKLIVISVVGFLAAIFLSIFTSVDSSETVSQAADATLSWYVPFFAAIYVIENYKDIVFVLRTVCLSAILVAALGIVEFRFQHRFLFDVFPRGMLEQLMAANPTFAAMVTSSPFREGIYRASSVFTVPLSFGEFIAIVIPIGLFFAIELDWIWDRIIGVIVVALAIVALYVSGARGGYVSTLVSSSVYIFAWTLRKMKSERNSLAAALAGLIGTLGVLTVVVLIIFWKRAHNLVLGGSSISQGSTDARWQQWELGWPHILSNPLTGHGFPLGATIINWNQGASIDSGYLSLLVETGLLGFISFASLLLLPIWYGGRRYFDDLSQAGALSGALACSVLAFGVNRLVLSQRENHMLLYVLIAVLIVLRYFEAEGASGAGRSGPGAAGPRKRSHGSGQTEAVGQTSRDR